MKRSTLFTLIAFVSFASYAQNFKITTADDEDVTNGVLVIAGTDPIMEESLYLENLAPDSVDVMLKRYEINVISNTLNYFCWGDCFEPIGVGVQPAWYALQPIRLGQNQVEQSGHAYYMHENNPGTSTFLYVFYDENDPTDSAWVEVQFEAPAYVGVNELTSADVRMNANPNPASQQVTIAYQLDRYRGTNASIAIVDLLGKKQGEYRLQNKKGKLVLDVDKFTPGIYFYSLQVEGRLISTKKLIVN